MDESELIISGDSKIYHLNLHPSELAETVITVGDPDRVAMVSAYFDEIETVAQHREFITHTGIYKNKRISVISTGIGPDNIDIVLNELDALVNIDFKTRLPRANPVSLNIIRIGTSGSLQPEIETDSFLINSAAVGMDNLLHFYEGADMFFPEDFTSSFTEAIQWDSRNSLPYRAEADTELFRIFYSRSFFSGCTVTNPGFYGPQGRNLRLLSKNPRIFDRLRNFSYKSEKITNLEMETAAIYALSKLMGHRAVSLNAIVANRAAGTFSLNPQETIDRLIKITLEKISSSDFF